MVVNVDRTRLSVGHSKMELYCVDLWHIQILYKKQVLQSTLRKLSGVLWDGCLT